LLDDKVLLYSWSPLTKLPTIVTVEKSIVTAKPEKALEVAFDSGLSIICGLDHGFYAFRGYPIPARNLQVGQSIRAFSGGVHRRDGHIRVHGWVNGKAKHQYTARMVWEYFFGKVPDGMIIHHKDYNKINNDIKNLELLSNSAHNYLHAGDRARGMHRRGRNHKVTGITLLKDRYDLCDFVIEEGLNYIIADTTPISGDFSGVVSSGFVED
jgi:hypothetical protein